MSRPGGTPLSDDQAGVGDLRAIVTEAFRLIPSASGTGPAGAGAGGGEGPAPSAVDEIVSALLDLQDLTGSREVPVVAWLSNGLSCAAPGAAGDPAVAAMRIRDLLLDAVAGDHAEEPHNWDEAEQQAADFATGTIQVVDS